MGKYVNQTSNGLVGASFKEKCEALLRDGAIEISEPEKFEENLVCASMAIAEPKCNNCGTCTCGQDKAHGSTNSLEYHRNKG